MRVRKRINQGYTSLILCRKTGNSVLRDVTLQTTLPGPPPPKQQRAAHRAFLPLILSLMNYLVSCPEAAAPKGNAMKQRAAGNGVTAAVTHAPWTRCLSALRWTGTSPHPDEQRPTAGSGAVRMAGPISANKGEPEPSGFHPKMSLNIFFTRTIDCQVDTDLHGSVRFDFQCTTQSSTRGNISLTFLVMIALVMVFAVSVPTVQAAHPWNATNSCVHRAVLCVSLPCGGARLPNDAAGVQPAVAPAPKRGFAAVQGTLAFRLRCFAVGRRRHPVVLVLPRGRLCTLRYTQKLSGQRRFSLLSCLKRFHLMPLPPNLRYCSRFPRLVRVSRCCERRGRGLHNSCPLLRREKAHFQQCVPL